MKSISSLQIWTI